MVTPTTARWLAQRSGLDVTAIAGDFFVIPAGHDAWVVGDAPVVSLGIDFTGEMEHYGEKS
jgi:hypothetical protein